MSKGPLRFLIFWATNSTLILAASWAYPRDFVLGSVYIPKTVAVLFSGFLLTFICKISRPAVSRFYKDLSGRYKMFVFYFLVNTLGLWLIARIAPISGLGISAYYWAIGFGFVASLIQWLVRQALKSSGLLTAR